MYSHSLFGISKFKEKFQTLCTLTFYVLFIIMLKFLALGSSPRAPEEQES